MAFSEIFQFINTSQTLVHSVALAKVNFKTLINMIIISISILFWKYSLSKTIQHSQITQGMAQLNRLDEQETHYWIPYLNHLVHRACNNITLHVTVYNLKFVSTVIEWPLYMFWCNIIHSNGSSNFVVWYPSGRSWSATLTMIQCFADDNCEAFPCV